jgi:transposase
LYEYIRTELSLWPWRNLQAACLDMCEPFWLSIERWAPNCRIVYNRFHILQHARNEVDEVRRAEFFRKGGQMRGGGKGKRWLLLTQWVSLTRGKRRVLNALFALNQRLLKAHLLTERLDRQWNYRYEGAMLDYLPSCIDPLRRQSLRPFQRLAIMLLRHLEGILNDCRAKVPLGNCGGAAACQAF